MRDRFSRSPIVFLWSLVEVEILLVDSIKVLRCSVDLTRSGTGCCEVAISSRSIGAITGSCSSIWLLVEALRALRSMSRMTKRLSFLNLLIKERQWILQIRRLLVEWRHAKLLVHESLMLPTWRSVSIMCVIPECSIIEVAQVWHHSIDASNKALILYISQNGQLLLCFGIMYETYLR